MAGRRVAVALVLLLCYVAVGQTFVLPILLKKVDLGYWPVFGYRYYPYQQQQLQQQVQQPEYQQREIIQVFPQYPPPDLYKTGQ